MVNVEVIQPTHKNGYWRLEFTTADDVAMHIVRKGAGRLIVEQSSVNDGNYMTIRNENMSKVCDFDLAAKVFPKYWRIKSESEIVSAAYTEGE